MHRLSILILILLPLQIWGQNFYFLQYSDSKNTNFYQEKMHRYDKKEEIEQEIHRKRKQLIKKGHILASIDSVNWLGDTAYVQLYQGQKFNTIAIDYSEKDIAVLKKTPKINERLIRRLPFSPEHVYQTLTHIHQQLTSSGYPFAQVSLKMDSIHPKQSAARLQIEKGDFVRFQKIHIKGEAKVQDKYIQSAISIKEGDQYNSSLLSRISNKIEEIQFIKEIRPYEILFTSEGAELFLYLESNPVSSINGIVGLQRDQTTGKTSFTGDIRLKLLNLLKRGESLHLNWKSLQPQTQELTLDLDFPFLFNTPFGVGGGFNLYKKDSTYLTTDFEFSVQYYLSGGSYIKAFYGNESSNLLRGASSLPNSNLSSVKTNRYGLGYHQNKLDYVPNPSRGYAVTATASAGLRKSRTAEEDSITSTSTTFKADLAVEFFLPIAPRHVIRLANQTQSYFAPEIYRNELFRFGGLQTQRGFNEEDLYATTLSTFSIEYRFLVDRQSHAFAFFDQSFYEQNSAEYIKDTPFGFGLGFSFGTNIGIFSISYAIGKQFDNPLQIKDGKVHFGYIAYF